MGHHCRLRLQRDRFVNNTYRRTRPTRGIRTRRRGPQMLASTATVVSGNTFQQAPPTRRVRRARPIPTDELEQQQLRKRQLLTAGLTSGAVSVLTAPAATVTPRLVDGSPEQGHGHDAASFLESEPCDRPQYWSCPWASWHSFPAHFAQIVLRRPAPSISLRAAPTREVVRAPHRARPSPGRSRSRRRDR